LLALLHAARVPFTTGSDAHHVPEIGDRFAELRQALTAAGVETVTTFERRTARRRPID
jgi:histidinol phosphatase-like PHP family hydrolase